MAFLLRSVAGCWCHGLTALQTARIRRSLESTMLSQPRPQARLYRRSDRRGLMARFGSSPAGPSVIVLAGILLLATTSQVFAHALAPSLLELREESAGRYAVLWKTPRMQRPGADLRPILPAHCKEIAQPSSLRGQADLQIRWRVDCAAQGLVGAKISVSGLETTRTAALLRIHFADGRSQRSLLLADAPEHVVTAKQSTTAVAFGNLRFGFSHILFGPDHLLFVLGLMFLIHGRRRLTLAVTAFTAGHSLTLALASLDLLSLPLRLVELGIAISLIVVAMELSRPSEAEESLLRRRPWSVSFAFGLLHGLGFASALREAGLPSDEITVALLCFNVGIALGQFLFIAGISGTLALLR